MADTMPQILTVDDLVRQQLARPVTVTIIGKDGEPRDDTRYEISARGRELLAGNQRDRAAWLQAKPGRVREALFAAIRGETPCADAPARKTKAGR